MSWAIIKIEETLDTKSTGVYTNYVSTLYGKLRTPSYLFEHLPIKEEIDTDTKSTWIGVNQRLRVPKGLQNIVAFNYLQVVLWENIKNKTLLLKDQNALYTTKFEWISEN